MLLAHDLQYAFSATIAVEQEVIAADITIALLILYLHALDVHPHSTFNRSRAETLLWGNDFRRSWPSAKLSRIKEVHPVFIKFWAIISRM